MFPLIHTELAVSPPGPQMIQTGPFPMGLGTMITVSASGYIGSGVIFNPPNTPGGWDLLAGAGDTDWAYHGHADSHRYCLIGTFVGAGIPVNWFFIGNAKTIIGDGTITGQVSLRLAVNRPFVDQPAIGPNPGDGQWDVFVDVFEPDPDGVPLYQWHNDGTIWRYTGTPFTGWQQLDNNPATIGIVVTDRGTLYQRHNDGSVWQYISPPFTGWQQLDNNPATADIVGASGLLYQRHNDGSVWLYVGIPPGIDWLPLDNNHATQIAAARASLYQLRTDGTIWQYIAPPPGINWQQLDNDPTISRIVVSADSEDQYLYKLHGDGSIWQWTGTPFNWQQLDNNHPTITIAAGASSLYQWRTDGTIWRYTGTPFNWQQLDNNPAIATIAAAASGDLYKVHTDGTIWRYTGTPFNWQQLDNNPATVLIEAGSGYQ